MCDLKELQNVEYDILCDFDDFCREHNLKYQLYGGTLLGAVRHNGFIPWDDDIDLIMDVVDFRKFIKTFKKYGIDGYFCSSYQTENEAPNYMLKLRKNGTLMPEYNFRKLNIHNGIFIDIFCWFNKPDSPFLIKFQETLLGAFQMMREKYLTRRKLNDGEIRSMTKMQKIIDKLPISLNIKLSTFMLWLASILASNKSKYVRFFDYNGDHCQKIKREFVNETIKHKFVEREFDVPKLCNELLTVTYGENYMTPV